MKELDFNTLAANEKLYNYQLNNFDFYSGYLINDEFYPMPIRERELIDNLRAKYKDWKFPFDSYIEGFKFGYMLPLPESKDNLLNNIPFDYNSFTYYQIDGVVTKSSAKAFGQIIGAIYRAFEVIISRIDEYSGMFNMIPEQKPFDGLFRKLSDKQLDKLFKFLTDENKAFSKPTFIDIKITDRQSFDYIFGGKEKPIQFKPIEWQANNQWLREILAGLQKIKNYHKDTSTLQLSNEIERQASDYFTKKGEAINIKSTKQLKDKPEYKAISKFLATI